MYYSDNPGADFERWSNDMEAELARLPVCYHCGEPIQDDYLYNINGNLYCHDCLDECFKESTDNHISEEDF